MYLTAISHDIARLEYLAETAPPQFEEPPRRDRRFRRRRRESELDD